MLPIMSKLITQKQSCEQAHRQSANTGRSAADPQFVSVIFQIMNARPCSAGIGLR